ncbi:amidinotransferase [Streptomyces natalensis ATCC 27448]|uniref:Amidinotransferase n=1 Tax=Streptomyces natalensis ATCC 27448 TaxID=1240678 RepID=A0A0D7CSN6_9ACTN|nr:amidinotransferase [Streptomyces natalensis ATCC 27448]
MARPRRYLVCEPRYFAVHYAINPWMDKDAPVDTARAAQQWQTLIRTYLDHGHQVVSVPPVPGLPDMVFAANSALTLAGRPRKAFGSLFHAAQRRPEAGEYATWFKAAGYDVYQPESVCEGEGDLVPAGRYLLAGTGFRTTREAHAEVQEFFGVPTIGLRLVDPYFYHLDTALFVVDDAPGDGIGGSWGDGTGNRTGEATIAYYPEAFSSGSREVLRQLFPDALLATRDDALAFGLNSVSDGRHVFISPTATGLIAQLTDRGYLPVPVDLSEFHKAGGGIKCCTQEIR